VNPESIKGDWSKWADARVGRDCLKLTVHLVALDEEVATLRADYDVPDAQCWEPSFDWMAAPVDGARPNNFEQVKRADPQWMALWGYETFSLNLKLDRKSKRIIAGDMDNPLDWHGRACLDDELQKCGDIPPMKYRRRLELELLAEG
jgi:hypothetical protein